MCWDEIVSSCCSYPGARHATQPEMESLRVGSSAYAYPVHTVEEEGQVAWVSFKFFDAPADFQNWIDQGHAQPAFYPHKSWWMVRLGKLDPVTAHTFLEKSYKAALKRLKKAERDAAFAGRLN